MHEYKHLTDEELYDVWIDAVNTLSSTVLRYKQLRLDHAASRRSEATRIQLQTAHNDIVELTDKIGRCHDEFRRRENYEHGKSE